MEIPARKTARFGAFAMLASAALLLSVVVPDVIAMDTGPEVEEQGQTSEIGNSNGVSQFTNEDEPPVTPAPPAVTPDEFAPPKRGFKGLRFLRRKKDSGLNQESDVLNGGPKKSFWGKSFQRWKKDNGEGSNAAEDAFQEGQPKRHFWSRRTKSDKGSEGAAPGWSFLKPRSWFGRRAAEPEGSEGAAPGRSSLKPRTWFPRKAAEPEGESCFQEGCRVGDIASIGSRWGS